MITFKAKTENDVIVRSTYRDMSFPAGETHIQRDPYVGVRPTEIAIVQFSAESLHRDLFTLEMWTQIIDGTAGGGTKKVVVMPYLPGARADKGYPRGAASYATFLSTIGIDQLIIADPHSPFWLKAFNTASNIWGNEPTEITTLQAADILSNTVMDQYDGIIAPDEGATQRAALVAHKANLPLHVASKERDFETGKLLKFNLPEKELDSKGKYLLVDDICDGGGTFSGLSLAIFHEFPDIELDLYVTHGVFSGDALHDLPATFNKIYTTNSYLSRKHDKLPEQFEVLDIISQMLKYV